MKKNLMLFAVVIILGAAAVLLFRTKGGMSTTIASQTDFVISDTASIGKIFLADIKGNTITLSREESGWIVNGKFKAREDAVETLLKTFKNVYIQRPVPKSDQEQVNSMMSTVAKKAEIYDLNGEWLKTWYVGHGTMDKKGTYMLLETPQHGKSEAPYILDMKGFIGMLNTRFFLNEEEWRSVVIFKYPELTLQEVKIEYPGEPENGFRITYGGGNDLKLYALESEEPIADFDSTLVKDYLLNFKIGSFSNFNSYLSPQAQDSVLGSTPYQIVTLTDPSGTKSIRLWNKKAPEGQVEMDNETPALIDREHLYAATTNSELALAQRQLWDKFRAPITAFTNQK